LKSRKDRREYLKQLISGELNVIHLRGFSRLMRRTPSSHPV
jgi:hypothetical protein